MHFRLGTIRAKALAELFPALKEMDAPLGLDLTVEPVRPKRTPEQNARYWKIIEALAEFSGLTKAEMHEEVLCEFHGYDLVEFRGTERKRPKGRSRDLKRTPFSDLMAIAERWAAEMGVSWDQEAA